MSELEVRRFEAGDGERVRALNDRAMATTPEYLPDVPDEDLDDVRGNYLAVDGAEFLVGELEGEVVATGAYVPLTGAEPDWKASFVDVRDGDAEVTRMRVDPDHHGRGFGTRVYRALERRAVEDGYGRFVLDTGVENDRARGFYESLGFACEREVTVEWGDLALDLAIYAREIG